MVKRGKRGGRAGCEGFYSPGTYLVMAAKPVITLVRHDNASLFGIDSGIGKICRVAELALGDGLEESGLSDVRKTDLFLAVSKHPPSSSS